MFTWLRVAIYITAAKPAQYGFPADSKLSLVAEAEVGRDQIQKAQAAVGAVQRGLPARRGIVVMATAPEVEEPQQPQAVPLGLAKTIRAVPDLVLLPSPAPS